MLRSAQLEHPVPIHRSRNIWLLCYSSTSSAENQWLFSDCLSLSLHIYFRGNQLYIPHFLKLGMTQRNCTQNILMFVIRSVNTYNVGFFLNNHSHLLIAEHLNFASEQLELKWVFRKFYLFYFVQYDYRSVLSSVSPLNYEGIGQSPYSWRWKSASTGFLRARAVDVGDRGRGRYNEVNPSSKSRRLLPSRFVHYLPLGREAFCWVHYNTNR